MSFENNVINNNTATKSSACYFHCCHMVHVKAHFFVGYTSLNFSLVCKLAAKHKICSQSRNLKNLFCKSKRCKQDWKSTTRLFAFSESQEQEWLLSPPHIYQTYVTKWPKHPGSNHQLTCKRCRRSRRGGRSCPGRWPLLPPQSPHSHCSECRACVGSPACTDTHHSSWRIPPGRGRSRTLQAAQTQCLITCWPTFCKDICKNVISFAVERNNRLCCPDDLIVLRRLCCCCCFEYCSKFNTATFIQHLEG